MPLNSGYKQHGTAWDYSSNSVYMGDMKADRNWRWITRQPLFSRKILFPVGKQDCRVKLDPCRISLYTEGVIRLSNQHLIMTHHHLSLGSAKTRKKNSPPHPYKVRQPGFIHLDSNSSKSFLPKNADKHKIITVWNLTNVIKQGSSVSPILFYPQVSLTKTYPRLTHMAWDYNIMTCWSNVLGHPAPSMLWCVVHISFEPVYMAYFTVPPSNPVLLGTATLLGPLPISPPLSFNLAAVKTANANWGRLDEEK